MFKSRNHPKLEKALGHTFKRQDYLQRALTHSSVTVGVRGRALSKGSATGGSGPKPSRLARRASGKSASSGAAAAIGDNERLEFLGDRVLGLAISELLIERFPDASEGELARRFNWLVCGDACTAVAKDIDLGAFVVVSDSEAAGGGRGRDTILADAIEAVLAAVFLDAGFDKARGVVRRLWDPYTHRLPSIAVDAKTGLQEWAQGQGLALPRYVELNRTGPDHAPVFTAEVRIDNHAPAQGEGTSKRIAEQSAAGAFLVREGIWEQTNLDDKH
ncbi:MAG: ribonuclease III [Pseudomonadota bacterium]